MRILQLPTASTYHDVALSAITVMSATHPEDSDGVRIRILWIFLPKYGPKRRTSPVIKCVACASIAASMIGLSLSGKERPLGSSRGVASNRMLQLPELAKTCLGSIRSREKDIGVQKEAAHLPGSMMRDCVGVNA